MSAPPAAAGPTRTARLVDWFERRLNLTELLSFLTHFGLIYTPIDTTKPLRESLAEIGRRRLSAYASGPRIFGVLTGILFAQEAVTGLLLSFYYRPTPDAAFQSTRMIVRDVPFGWFVHQIHAWGAYLLIGVVALRLIRLFWDGLYKTPREVLWCAAVCMAWLAVQADMTGRLLTWDTHSYWGAVRALEVAYALPVFGRLLAFLVGGHVVNEDVLLRFYVLHVMVLPLLFASAIYITYGTLRRVGLSPAHDTRPDKTVSYRSHFYTLAILTVLLFAGLVTLAALVPFRFLESADPFTTPVGTTPPWYFLAPYALLQHGPGPLVVRGALWLGVALAVLFLPFWVKGDDRSGQSRRARVWGACALGAWFVLGVLGYILERR